MHLLIDFLICSIMYCTKMYVYTFVYIIVPLYMSTYNKYIGTGRLLLCIDL